MSKKNGSVQQPEDGQEIKRAKIQARQAIVVAIVARMLGCYNASYRKPFSIQ